MKRFFLCYICFFYVSAVYAQHLRWGIMCGANISTESCQKYSGMSVTSSKFKPGITVGGLICRSISKKINIEADFLYSLQGFKDELYLTNEKTIDEKRAYIVSSHYINIPIVAKYIIVNGLYVEIGSQVGFLLKKEDNLGNANDENVYGNTKINKMDFCVVAGVGYKFSKKIFINARYNHGFIDTSKIYGGGRNRSVQIALGYLL